MEINLPALVALLVPAVLSLGWLFRLDGRLNTADALLRARIQSADARFDEIVNRLVRIEQNQDRMIERGLSPGWPSSKPYP